MDWIEFFCFIYVGQAFWYNFFCTVQVVSCLVNLFLLCYVTCSYLWLTQRECRNFCFFVFLLLMLHVVAAECTRLSCTFENFACYRHISTEKKWIMYFSYMSCWLYKSVHAYWYKYKHVFGLFLSLYTVFCKCVMCCFRLYYCYSTYSAGWWCTVYDIEDV